MKKQSVVVIFVSGAALAVAVATVAFGPQSPASLEADRAAILEILEETKPEFAEVALAARQLRYDTEYEAIQYSTTAPTDAVARLQDRIAAGEVTLRFDARSGYLASLLGELGIDVDTQVLVFSKTSLQVDKISPESPRAIYFNDAVYVAWVPGGLVEISSVDPRLTTCP